MGNILLVDFGSTYTKVTMVDVEKESILSASSYSTVETDIRIGYHEAIKKLEKKAGTSLSFTRVLACSSAAGGLKMAAIGLVPELTVEAAKRTCMGAGAKVELVFSHKLISTDIKKIVDKNIDIILLSGGTDGGHTESILHNARLLKAADLPIPIIYAGNRDLQDEIKEIFKEQEENIYICDNVMHKINVLSMDSAKQAIREVFLKKIIEAKGIKKIESEMNEVIFPTPEAVLKAATLLSKGTINEVGLGDIMVIDVGGATTDIYSMSHGTPKRPDIVLKGLSEPFSKRTVEGDFGMRYSAMGVIDSMSEKELDAYLKEGTDLYDEAKRRSLNPEFLPQTEQDNYVDDIIAGQAIKQSMIRHVGTIEPYYTSMGMMYYQTGKNLQDIKLVIGTGGIIIHSKNRWEILKNTVSTAPFDLRPTNPAFSIDDQYILSAMGLLSTVNPDLALRIMKKNITVRKEYETTK